MAKNRKTNIVVKNTTNHHVKIIYIIIVGMIVFTSSFEKAFPQSTNVPHTKQIGSWRFDDKNISEWKLFDNYKNERPILLEKTPLRSNSFLGKLLNNTAELSVYNLIQHDSITISFDVYIIGTWDGNNKIYGRDIFMLKVDTIEYMKTTFSNTAFLQSYPDLHIGKKEHKAKTGAKAINKLGFTWHERNRYSGIMDAVYIQSA